MAVPSRYARVIAEPEWAALRLNELMPEDRDEVLAVADAMAGAQGAPEAERAQAVAALQRYADMFRNPPDLTGLSEEETAAAVQTAKRVVADMTGRPLPDENEGEEDEDDERQARGEMEGGE